MISIFSCRILKSINFVSHDYPESYDLIYSKYPWLSFFDKETNYFSDFQLLNQVPWLVSLVSHNKHLLHFLAWKRSVSEFISLWLLNVRTWTDNLSFRQRSSWIIRNSWNFFSFFWETWWIKCWLRRSVTLYNMARFENVLLIGNGISTYSQSGIYHLLHNIND